MHDAHKLITVWLRYHMYCLSVKFSTYFYPPTHTIIYNKLAFVPSFMILSRIILYFLNNSMTTTQTTITTDRKFWIWASVRIFIVVGLIVGAFLLGVRMGFGEFTARIGMDAYDRWGYYGPMMQHKKMQRNMPNMNECRQYLRELDGTGSATAATGTILSGQVQ